MNMTPKEYNRYVARLAQKSPLGKDLLRSFLVGGLICVIGQLILNGFTEPFDVPTPPASDSQTRQTAEMPYALVDLRGERAGYDRVFIHNAQIFPGIQTLQQIVLIPTPTLPDSYAQTQEFDIPSQAQDL